MLAIAYATSTMSINGKIRRGLNKIPFTVINKSVCYSLAPTAVKKVNK